VSFSNCFARKILVLGLALDLAMAPLFVPTAIAEEPPKATAKPTQDDILNSGADDPDAGKAPVMGPAAPATEALLPQAPAPRPDLKSITPPESPLEHSTAGKIIDGAASDMTETILWVGGGTWAFTELMLARQRNAGRVSADYELQKLREQLPQYREIMRPWASGIEESESEIHKGLEQLPKRSAKRGESQSDLLPYYGAEVCGKMLRGLAKGQRSVVDFARRNTEAPRSWISRRFGRNRQQGVTSSSPVQTTESLPAPETTTSQPTPVATSGPIHEQNKLLSQAYENWRQAHPRAAQTLDGLPIRNGMPVPKEGSAMQVTLPGATESTTSHRLLRDAMRDVERYMTNYENALALRAGRGQMTRMAKAKAVGARVGIFFGIIALARMQGGAVATANKAVEDLEDTVNEITSPEARKFALGTMGLDLVLTQMAKEWDEYSDTGKLPRAFEGTELPWKPGLEANRAFLAEAYKKAEEVSAEKQTSVGTELWIELIANLLLRAEQNKPIGELTELTRKQYGSLAQELGDDLPRFLQGNPQQILADAVQFEMLSWQFAADTLWSSLQTEGRERLAREKELAAKELAAKAEADKKAAQAAPATPAPAAGTPAPAPVPAPTEPAAPTPAAVVGAEKKEAEKFPFDDVPMPFSAMLPDGLEDLKDALAEARRESLASGKNLYERFWVKVFTAAELSYNKDAVAPDTVSDTKRFENEVQEKYKIWIQRLVLQTPSFYQVKARQLVRENEDAKVMVKALQKEIEMRDQALQEALKKIPKEATPMPAPVPGAADPAGAPATVPESEKPAAEKAEPEKENAGPAEPPPPTGAAAGSEVPKTEPNPVEPATAEPAPPSGAAPAGEKPAEPSPTPQP
jgi:hypothetical protein